MKRNAFAWFLCSSLMLCLFVFGDGLWGRSLLAPLDVLWNLYPKYSYLDPQANGVPANSHIIDQVGYDLPMQLTVYESYARGELPWWDPYAYGGRPFLADAHISAVDPIRVSLYRLLSFEWAYNWTIVAHFLLSGLTMFLLLQHLKFGRWVCVWLAVAYEFAGSSVLFIGHPWIQASFLFYPLLWLLWDKALTDPRLWRIALASLPVAAIFLAGNLQSHSYLVLFAGVFFMGRCWRRPGEWRNALHVMLLSVVVGAVLAAPVLGAEVEFFRNSTREIVRVPPTGWLSGALSLSTVFPWMLGTFRSLDVGKFAHLQGAGFLIYTGSIATVLAFFATATRPAAERDSLKRTALGLIIVYLVIMSSPLRNFFYARCAGLPVLGLTLLAAMGAEKLFSTDGIWQRFGKCVIGGALAVVIALNIVAFVIYPRLLPRVRKLVAEQSAKTIFGADAPALREFQVSNLPHEISVCNVETVAAALGLVGVGFLLLAPRVRQKPWCQPALLAFNLVPLLFFSARFMQRQPIEKWRQLLVGGPAQREVVDVMGGTQLRLWEIAPNVHQRLFPYDLEHLYKIRTVHGYSALQPQSLYQLSSEEQEQYRSLMGDYIYESRKSGQERGEFRKNPGSGFVRFQWNGASTRGFRVEQVGLNEIHVHFEDGLAGTLLWTDTRYPGWRATLDGRALALQPTAPICTSLEIPQDARELTLRYRPTYFLPATMASAGALVFIAGSLFCGLFRRRPMGATARG